MKKRMEELRKAEPENEVPYCILTKSLFLVPLVITVDYDI